MIEKRDIYIAFFIFSENIISIKLIISFNFYYYFIIYSRGSHIYNAHKYLYYFTLKFKLVIIYFIFIYNDMNIINSRPD